MKKKKKAELAARLARIKREIKRLSNKVRALKTIFKLVSPNPKLKNRGGGPPRERNAMRLSLYDGARREIQRNYEKEKKELERSYKKKMRTLRALSKSVPSLLTGGGPPVARGRKTGRRRARRRSAAAPAIEG